MEKQERKELLRQYMSIPRLSGYEKEMAYRFRDDLAPLADRAVIDRVGNVIATFEGSQKDAPALMIFAHMDVIGFIITCIDEKGFIKVDRMGGVPEKIVAATQVLVGTENGTYVNGLIAAKSSHVQSAEEKNIPLQRSAGRGALSDAAYLQLEGEGIPCMDMGCPDRYSHSMLECLSLDDHERTGALLAAFIDNLDNSFNLDRY